MATEEKTNQETTSIEQVEMNLDEILGTPGAENVMLPETEKKPNVFTKETTDLSFLDKDTDEEGSESNDNKPEEVKAAEVLKELDQEFFVSEAENFLYVHLSELMINTEASE